MAMAAPELKTYSAEELHAGLSCEIEREVKEEDVLAFAQNSGDFNPLHVDYDYAEGTSFGRRIVHGAYQVGLASSVLGMHLPGRQALLVSVNARFLKPLYFPARVRIRGEITSWNRHALSGNLRVVIEDVASHVSTSDVQLGFTFHETAMPASEKVSSVPVLPGDDNRRTILVTGAGGLLGTALVTDLCRDHFVIGLVNRGKMNKQLLDCSAVRQIEADLSAPDWEARIREAMGTRSLYGVIHAAWPGIPHGGLLGVPLDTIEQQLSFGTIHTIRLGRLLFSLVPEEGGRFINLGSLLGSQKPQIAFSTYSLGKASLEQTVRLLAPEMARKKITINAICPFSVGLGIHKHANDVQRMKETASVPMGRLCTPEDVVGMVRFLLSPQSAYLSGQSIPLSGAQL